jgi:hypothetical protein
VTRLIPLLAALFLLGALAPAAQAGGPSMTVGVVDDVVKQDTLAATKAKFDLMRLAGVRAVRISAIWSPGLRAPTSRQQRILDNVSGAAQLDAMDVWVAVYNETFRTTPLSDRDQADFAAYCAALARQNPSITHIVVGNEPNLNRFWMPQFGTDGSDVAAPAYESLLAKTYDALKAVDTDITVVGVAVSPRGVDRPNTGRDTHSPVTFLSDIGAAYRASGRQVPIMDMLAIHVYEDNSSLPPTFQHPNPANTTISVNDYTKLESVLSRAFDGTAQPGSTLPIDYGEFGVETQIPAAKAALYTGKEPATTKPTDETTQGLYYRQALALTFCQPNVTAFFFLHAVDEPDLDRWQSGVYYANATPKTSLPAVLQAIRDTRGGVVARCAGLALTPHAKASYPRGAALASVPLSLAVTCDIDCNYYVRLEKLPRHSTTLAVSGRARAGVRTKVTLPARRVASGRYRFTLRLTAPVNIGRPLVLKSKAVTIR